MSCWITTTGGSGHLGRCIQALKSVSGRSDVNQADDLLWSSSKEEIISGSLFNARRDVMDPVEASRRASHRLTGMSSCVSSLGGSDRSYVVIGSIA